MEKTEVNLVGKLSLCYGIYNKIDYNRKPNYKLVRS